MEVDETFVGGKLGKAIVMGLLDRGRKEVRAKVVANVSRHTLQPQVEKEVKFGAVVYTDQLTAYENLRSKYAHDVINHTEEYVNGRVHTNGIENFWALLKRGIGGTYVAVEPFHLERYVDEQVFRYNNRATADNPMNDFDRFSLAVSNIVGKRVTYKELTGKESETPF